MKRSSLTLAIVGVLAKWLLIVSAIVIAPVVSAHAQTAMSFYNQCGNSFTAGFLNRSYCHSYITGLVNGMVEGGSNTVCLPAGVTDTQLVMVVQAYMRGHPDQLNDSANDVVEQAVTNAFPCAPFNLTGLQRPGQPSPLSMWHIVVLLLAVVVILIVIRIARWAFSPISRPPTPPNP